MDGHDQSDLVYAIAQGTLLSLPILARIGEKWHKPPFISLFLPELLGGC